MPYVGPIDIREFARFFVSGVSATVANMLTVWFVRRFVPFQTALVGGIAAAILISFILSKIFAFRSFKWTRARGEAARFLVVYASGCAMYWTVAVCVRKLLLARGVAIGLAELGGILVGAGMMMLTSYCGHRYFTYQTYQQASDRSLGVD